MTSFIAETQKALGRHWRLAYMGFAFVVAVLYDVFFWDLRLGLGFLVFVLCYIFGFITLSVITKQFREPKALLLFIPIFVLSADIVFYNNRLVTELVPWVVVILLFLFSVLLTLQNPHKYRFSLAHIPILRNVEMTFFQWSDMWKDLFRWEHSGNKKITKIIWGIALAIPLLFIFGALFAAADAVFADVLKNIFDIDGPMIWRIFRTGVITLFLSSIFYALLSDKNTLGQKVQRAVKLDRTVVATMLALVNALFLVFVIIQFRYLFGGIEYVSEQGVTFADYARNGFFQLVWVIGLAALMLIFLYRSASHHGSHVVLKLLKVFLIVQVGIIAVSALHRMNLYQDAFGFTVLRLYVEWFTYFSLLILAFAGVSLLANWPFRSFFYTSVIFGFAAFTTVASVNVDQMIAQENVDRYINERKELDMAYLIFDLSVDAVPEVDRAFGHGFAMEAGVYGSQGQKMFQIAYENYQNIFRPGNEGLPSPIFVENVLHELPITDFPGEKWRNTVWDWREYNVGRERAAKYLYRHIK